MNSVRKITAADTELSRDSFLLEDTTTTLDDDDDESSIYSRPIVVGYAFGPKKMSTMGVVMAEASKAKLSAAKASTTEQVRLREHSSGCGAFTVGSDSPLTRARLSTHEGEEEEAAAYSYQSARNVSSGSEETHNGATTNFVFTIDSGKIQGGSDLRNIVQHFRSSCSSVGSMSTGITACSTSVTSIPRTSMSCSSVASSHRKQHPHDSKIFPVRVSFVPLDLGKYIGRS
jgi:hypothetical protein